MTRAVATAAIVMSLVVCTVVPSGAADDSKVKAATGRVESGARQIGDGKLADGVEETAKGIGHTVVEGAKLGAQKIQESGQAAEPEATRAGASVRDGAVSFGSSVMTFVRRMFTR